MARRTLMMLVIILLLTSCVSTRPARSRTQTKKHASEAAPRKGFVREVDEPSTRGQLIRISPPDMDIMSRFVLSPDGKSVLFAARRAGSKDPYQLYRVDMGSVTPVKITSGSESDAWYPSFTPDGENIVYYMDGCFWKTRRDGSRAKVKIPGSGVGLDMLPVLSSDSNIVFVSYGTLRGAESPEGEAVVSGDRYLIWTCRLNGGDLTQYREGLFPVWSPDGSKIAFEYEDDIWMMSSDGTELTQLTSTKDVGEYKPAFSPDGQHLAYTSNEDSRGRKGSDYNIWYMKVDGTSKAQVTELKSWDSWPYWGPDGIYFLSGRAKGQHPAQRIWVIKGI